MAITNDIGAKFISSRWAYKRGNIMVKVGINFKLDVSFEQ